MSRLAPTDAIVHRAGRRWHVRPGQQIRLLEGDIVEHTGQRTVVEEQDVRPPAQPARGHHAGGPAALALAAFLGLTSPVSAAETAAATTVEQQGKADEKKPDNKPDESATRKPSSQTGKIKGRVLLTGSRKPARDVSVLARNAEGTDVYGQTDERGAFEIEDLPPGKYQVRIDARGDAVPPRSKRTVRVRPGATVTVALETDRPTLFIRKTPGVPPPRHLDEDGP